MNKIGVIGATGMLGHHVAKEVIRVGGDLHIIHRANSNLDTISDLDYKSRVADLNDVSSLANAVEGLDYVLNCGAYYPTTPKPLLEEMKIAKQQMANFISVVKHSEVTKALYVGAAIAIPKAKRGLANETLVYPSAPKDKTAYLQVKWLMDKMARDAGQAGVPLVIGIPSMTFGEYDYGPSTGRLIVNAVNQTLPGYVAGNRNVIYAGDAARGLVQACLRGEPGERYLVTGDNISMQNLMKKIVKKAHLLQAPKKVPLFVAKIMSKIKMSQYKKHGGDLPLLDETAIAVMSAGQFLDGSKAEQALSFKAKVSMDEMLDKTLLWFKENGYT